MFWSACSAWMVMMMQQIPEHEWREIASNPGPPCNVFGLRRRDDPETPTSRDTRNDTNTTQIIPKQFWCVSANLIRRTIQYVCKQFGFDGSFGKGPENLPCKLAFCSVIPVASPYTESTQICSWTSKSESVIRMVLCKDTSAKGKVVGMLPWKWGTLATGHWLPEWQGTAAQQQFWYPPWVLGVFTGAPEASKGDILGFTRSF